MTKQQIVQEFRKAFVDEIKLNDKDYPSRYFKNGISPDTVESFLLSSLDSLERETRQQILRENPLVGIAKLAVEEERERINKAMQPVFDDFNAAAQRMIEIGSLKRTGTEIIENIGYMKSLLLSPLSEKLPKEEDK